MHDSDRTAPGRFRFVYPALVAGLLLSGGAATGQDAVFGVGAARFDTRWDSGVRVTSNDLGPTMVLRADGSLVGFGANRSGECEIPPALAGTAVLDFSAAVGLSLVLYADGQIRAFGNNLYGQADVPPLPSGLRYTRLAEQMGLDVAALRSDGTLVRWGRGGPVVVSPPTGTRYVQLGSPFIALRSDGQVDVWDFSGQPISAPPLPTGVLYSEVASGTHFLARRTDGLTVAWRQSSSWAAPNLPDPPVGLSYTDIAAGREVSYGLRSDGRIVAVGPFNSYGQLDVPPLPASTVYLSITDGGSGGRALRSDGRVVSWGNDSGYSGVAPRSRPGGEFEQVDVVGAGVAVMLRRDGVVETLGAASGNPSQPSPYAGPFHPGEGLEFVEVAAGIYHFCMLRSDGVIVYGGGDSFGATRTPDLPPGQHYIAVGAGSHHTLAIRSDGALLAFGDNSRGQCNVPPLPTGIRYVAADGGHTYSLALRSDGAIVHFGEANPGGSTVTRVDAIPDLPPGVVYRKLAAARYHCVALRSDGRVVGWGDNGFGQISIPSLPAGVYYVDVAVGAAAPPFSGRSNPRYTMLLRSDGEVDLLGNPPIDPVDLPEAGPGATFAGFAGAPDIAVFRVTPTSRYEPLGPGCAGSLPPARIVPHTMPRVGESLKLSLRQLPEDRGVLLLGSGVGAPVDLTPFGFPGCELRASGDIAESLLGQAGVAVYRATIPTVPALVGARVALQAVVLDRGAPGGLVFSEAAAAVVGR